ncbi:GNAT family N-acetyltransferase [Kitasatospora sp. NPDC058965]|uniref:GNAT family N-acetyltransferase n=1 Tax=Kitasatospora sp. NPDC058965 TaxID=3346682 RepID=UPI0036C387DF
MAADAVTTAFFTHPLGDGAVLMPRTAQIAEAYHAVLVANNERLARWEPWAVAVPEPDGTREFLEQAAHGWLAGTQLPVAIGVAVPGGGYRIVGSLGLRIGRTESRAELGYWIDADHEGRGLVRRGAEVLIEHAFGPLGMDRVELTAEVGNLRSRALAERLGFTEVGVEPAAIVFPTGSRDRVRYALTAADWRAARP